MFSADSYLKFIGLNREEISPSFETLLKLQKLHSTQIPFDNFDFHLENHQISVLPDNVWNKIKDGKRGTFCFEGNFLFAEALKQLGFNATLIPVCFND